jgi:hypothetical protein
MTAPLICCVKVGTAYGPEYVTNLRNGVARFCPVPHDFVCFTDSPIEGVDCRDFGGPFLPKWWSKVQLFGLKQPLIYLDLDVVMVGDLQPLLEWDGFGVIRNPWLPGYNSSVMKLTGNEGFVWDRFTPGVMASFRGDQDWLNVAYPNAPTFPPAWFPSWKIAKLFKLDAPPPDAIAVNMHGFPKPAQITHGWVKDYWTGNIPAKAA